MFRIHWLNILFIITVFPGIILFLLERFSIFNKLISIERYVFALAIVSSINLIYSKSLIYPLLIIIMIPIILFLFEYMNLKDESKTFKKVSFYIREMKRFYLILVLIPIMEELVFRYFIYEISIIFKYTLWQYILLSVLSFTFVHFFEQGAKALIKIPFALIQSIVFLYSMNIYICFLIHIIFNILVYLFNISRYSKGKSYIR